MESDIDLSSQKNLSTENTSPTKDKYNNGWTEKKEKLLKYWQEECRLYVWLHNKNSTYYRQLNRILTLPAILITATTSTALFSTIGSSGDDGETSNNQKAIAITFGILLIIGAFLQSAREFLDIEKQIHRNTNSSISYQGIVNEIEVQLTQDIQDRSDGKLFLQKIKNSKNDIVRNGPTISSGTWDQLKIGIRNGDVINLYGTSFFQDYIANLDNIDKDINSNINPNIETNTPTATFNNVLRSSNGAIMKSLRNEKNEEDNGRIHFANRMGNKTIRYKEKYPDFSDKINLKNNLETNENLFNEPVEDFNIIDKNIIVPLEDVVIYTGMDDTGTDTREYINIAPIDNTPEPIQFISPEIPDKVEEEYSEDDKDVEDSFSSNMGMQQIQQNLNIPIGNTKNNRSGLLKYQLGRL